MAIEENSAKSSASAAQEALAWIGRQFTDDDKADTGALVEAFANMQARACRKPHLLAAFAPLDVAALPARLLRFLHPDAADEPGTARNLLGRSGCAGYHNALSRRADLLGTLLKKTAALPLTINHGGLLPQSGSLQAGETRALTDWSGVLVGPAGLSLHALCGGCAAPAALLAGSDELKLAAEQRHLQPVLTRYLDALAAQDYASSTMLEDCLPGSICAGAINAALCCTATLETSKEERARVKRDLQARLSDLLDLCDLLAVADRDSALRCARDYYNNERRWRAERLLRGYTLRNEQDAEVLARLAWLLHKRRKPAAAISAYQKALALDPANALLHQQLGDAQLHQLQYETARSSFDEALHHGGPRQDIAESLAWLGSLQHCEQQARRDSTVPTVTLTEYELRSQKWRDEHLALGVKLFHRYGVLLIHQAFNEPLLEACQAEFIRRYAEYFTETTHPHALRIGDKRYQISVALEGAFNNPSLYANPFILAIMRRLLGDEFLLGCTVCATALPGAKEQHLHKDHRALFASSADETPLELPPFAITTMVPLVTLDEKIGTTGVKKGSHLLSQPDSRNLPSQLPMVPRGSCFLMDLRLTHGGLANRTDRVRPIMNMVYQRYWFADNRNFAKHPPLRIAASEYRRIPKKNRYLFAWGAQPGPQVEC